MESKMIIRESSNKEFQILEKVRLDEFDTEKSRKMESNLNDEELQKVIGLRKKGLDLWSEFYWFEDEGLIKLILS